MPTSKKSRKSSAVIHLQCWSGCESSGYAKKKSTFYKEQAPKQVEAYLEKIKDIPKEKLVYIDETGPQTQMYRQYARSKRGKRVNIRISGKRHARIGLVAAQCEGRCLLRTPTAERWKLLCSKSGLKMNCWAVCRKDMSSSWTTRCFTGKRSCIKSQKIFAGTDFPTAVFTWIQAYWAQVERFEAKSCWLCSSLWLRFSGSECCFRRQLAI